MLPFNSYRAYGPPIDGGDGPRLPSLFIIVEAIASPASTIGGGRVTADIIRLEGIEPATFKFEI